MPLVNEISFLNAFWGGFYSYFTVAQLCLMQISPFFIAFLVGVHFSNFREIFPKRILAILPISIGYIISFSILFGALGIRGIGFARYIKYNMADFKVASAVIIVIIVLFILVMAKLEIERYVRILYFPVGLLLGASFAIAYAPCITPTMSDIMNFGSSPENATKGMALLTVYALGVSLSFIAVGSVVSVSVSTLVREKSKRKLVVMLSMIFLLILPALLISGYMIDYKTFLVGLLVE